MSNNDVFVARLKELLKPIIEEMVKEELRQNLHNKEPPSSNESGVLPSLVKVSGVNNYDSLSL